MVLDAWDGKKNEDVNKALESGGALSVSAFCHICKHNWIAIKLISVLKDNIGQAEESISVILKYSKTSGVGVGWGKYQKIACKF